MSWLLAGAAAIPLFGFSALRAAPFPAGPRVGANVAAFTLPASNGQQISLASLAGKKVLVLAFIGNECPISNSYAPLLSHLTTEYGPLGVAFLGVNSVPGETAEAVRKHAQEFRLAFPILKDADQALARAVGARVTPEVFVLDAQRVVRYAGRIDDRYASRTLDRGDPRSHDLERAIKAVLAGKPVDQPVTRAFGCSLAPLGAAVADAKVTYYRDVAPILQERCQACHRPGQIGPFSLLSLEDAQNWAQEIAQFTQNRKMPPWGPAPEFGEFRDVRRLSDREISTILEWVSDGTPAGDPKDAPKPRQWTEGWMLGKPDLVLEMPEEYHVAPGGKDDFHCFVIPTHLAEDRQVVAVDVQPGNTRVVHHVLDFVDTTGAARALDAKDPGPGYETSPGGVGFVPSGGMGGWAPGNLPHYLPAGSSLTLPKGADVVLQLHYHKTGKPETDRTRIGLYFAKGPTEHRLRSLPLTNLGIDIPPNDEHHEVTAHIVLPFDVHAYDVTPHMHLLGREMKVWATLPNGEKKEIVWIKDWDYRWQDTYYFKQPIAFPKGTRFDLVAYYDNSDANALNPNKPPKRVTFGEQTTDEMCFAFIDFTLDHEPAVDPGITLFRQLIFQQLTQK